MTNELSAKLMQKNSMRQLRQLRHFKSNDLSENEQIRQKCLKCLMQIFIQAAWHAGQWTTYEENAARKTIRLRWASGLRGRRLV